MYTQVRCPYGAMSCTLPRGTMRVVRATGPGFPACPGRACFPSLQRAVRAAAERELKSSAVHVTVWRSREIYPPASVSGANGVSPKRHPSGGSSSDAPARPVLIFPRAPMEAEEAFPHEPFPSSQAAYAGRGPLTPPSAFCFARFIPPPPPAHCD
ncbi:hypothetical protein SKAU_G00047950 [Synaphobranchus kaupii]|uniref:Uncharacterized protein n=1 Tax=Synaphobranchus kaupii TaxID=118154 RepID=A0A9Q1G2K5_SYNKA|nr:hypothetical protein SKAU_G00047950 [Synaphobranchus kaupii]